MVVNRSLLDKPVTMTDIEDLGVDHGSLSGLGDDDHTQYLLAAGTRELSGHWNVGTDFDISVPQINLTPRSTPLRAARGGIYYDDEDDCVYVCTSAA